MSLDLNSSADFESLCVNAVAEGLRLEFKEKEDPSTATLSRGDKKQIAEPVSSFANSDGGTIIFGVKTEKRSGSDVAVNLRPIADIEQFASNFRMVCSLNVSPPVPHTEVRAIACENTGQGFIVCEVSRSDKRPHMSTAPGVHSYFRRSFEGNVPMTPSEVRDQILAVRDAILEPVVPAPAGGSFSMNHDWVSARVSFVFYLRNVGQALCRIPFLRVKSSCKLHSHQATYDRVLRAWKTEFPYGTLIHVEDQLRCLSLAFHACVRFDILRALFKTEAMDLTESVMIFPGSDNYHTTTVTDKVSLSGIDFELRFGAENAPATTAEISFSRRQLAKAILSQSTIVDMYTQNVGIFREDLVRGFDSSSDESEPTLD